MSRHERLNRLLELLAADGQLEVDEAATLLSVSAATVRRDLDSLAGQQLLIRTHGGAVGNGSAYDLPLRHKGVRHAEQKLRIARAAVELVSSGAVVGLSGGTTCTEVGRALAIRAVAEPASITVVTNALNIATELAVRSQIKLVVLGGVPRPHSYELTGPLGAAVLGRLSLDLAIIGVDGIDAVRGASCQDEARAETGARIARQARRIVVVADSSKLGRSAFAQLVRVDEVQLLITDTDAEPELVKELTGSGMEVVQV